MNIVPNELQLPCCTDPAPNYRTQVYKHRPDIVLGGVCVSGEVYLIPNRVHM